MFIVELRFTDAPGRLDARPAHRERVTALHGDGKLVMAGPFPDDSGAMLLFDVADEVELASVLAADPYYSHPAVQVTRRQEWHPVFR